MEQQETAADLPTGFLSLPSELRNKIYELSLVKGEDTFALSENIRRYFYHKRGLASGLLLASKAIHREASPILYGQNRFDFCEVSPRELRTFLNQIGKNNASYIRHVTIDFPGFRSLYGEISLERDIAATLEAIRGACDNIITITAFAGNNYYRMYPLSALDRQNAAPEVISLINTRFRSMTSLQEIIVEIDDDSPSDGTRKIMESHGWLLRKCEPYKERWDVMTAIIHVLVALRVVKIACGDLWRRAAE
ncbi:hypothetical protein KVR01_007005 [Diaporthe batatas]|uniref:uncharacterized protein n=1 Tax=Diaporthe batatas TaxID=748121 RepID=UPI001D03D839|nr:uncharacterized protein KVR01_007005 [Diaporthe batatas]KAG8163708.1 hypothetical protein KVR01_007005 [Diaporthe batatas]